jgi:NAD-dependent SIR2 family protein deacetylase
VTLPRRSLGEMIGEKLSDDFDKHLLKDREEVDLLLVIGTSLKVRHIVLHLAFHEN